MESVSTVEAKAHLSDLVNRAVNQKERTVLTRRGKPVAVVIPVEDLATLEDIEEQEDLRDFDEGLKSAETEGTVPLEQVKRRLGLE